MSFLLGAGDSSSTLEEVVAFIDSWNTNPTLGGGTTTSESESDCTPFSNADVESVLLDSLDDVLEDASFLPPKELQQPKKPAKKKRKKNPGASTRLQREILALRSQADQLEERLAQLKLSQAGPTPSIMAQLSYQPRSGANVSSLSWSAIAAAQFQERLKSATINQRLRAALMEQVKMSKALRDAFQVQASLGDVVFGKQAALSAQHPLSGTDSALTVIGELEKMVEGLYLNSAEMFQSTSIEMPSTNTALDVKQNQACRRMIEITATTPLLCSIQDTSAIL